MARALKKKNLGNPAHPALRRPIFDGCTSGPQTHADPAARSPRTLSEAGADWSDAAALNITRIFFAAITDGDAHHGWIAAYDTAEELFDPRNGPQVATLAGKVVRAIRHSRRSGFRFNTPCCADCARHLTPEEAQLLSALRALRNHQIHRADQALSSLCEGHDTGEVTLWLRELAMALPPLAPTRLH